MKKSNILVAVLAVLAAASVAKAEEIKIDFDGANKGLQPQSMHSIFAAAHNIVPAGMLKTDAETNKRLLGGSGDPCCDDPTILCYAPCQDEGDVLKSVPAGGAQTMVRPMSYKAQQAQLEALWNINKNVIKDPKLEALLNAQGTSVWFSGPAVYVLNAEMTGRFTIKDASIIKALRGDAEKGQNRFSGVDILVTGIIEVGHIIVDEINEYGSWPPVPDSGMANYDPVTGNDYSPGWGE